MSKNYRSHSRLVMDVLSAVASEGPVGVTRLLFLANTTHGRLQEHLNILDEQGWVKSGEDDGRAQWQVTDEGRKVLAELRRIDRAMQDFGLAL